MIASAPRRQALADSAFPRANIWLDAALVVLASLFIAGSAQVRIPLPFSPVPITGQTLAVLLAGAALGARRGALAALLYLAEGSAGMPVFSGGASGPVWGMASGGYIAGFVPAAFAVGWLAERGWDRGPWLVGAMILANALVYLPGLLQLGLILDLGPGRTLELGLYPFIPGDLVKIVLATLAMPGAWAFLRRVRQNAP